jgi:hypothetical protein
VRVLEGGQAEKPAILVLSCVGGRVENEVLAGIEEEGVPSVVERPRRHDAAGALARVLGHNAARIVVGIPLRTERDS